MVSTEFTLTDALVDVLQARGVRLLDVTTERRVREVVRNLHPEEQCLRLRALAGVPTWRSLLTCGQPGPSSVVGHLAALPASRSAGTKPIVFSSHLRGLRVSRVLS
jgi:hypothetical protein